jgi:hypothetical protein
VCPQWRGLHLIDFIAVRRRERTTLAVFVWLWCSTKIVASMLKNGQMLVPEQAPCCARLTLGIRLVQCASSRGGEASRRHTPVGQGKTGCARVVTLRVTLALVAMFSLAGGLCDCVPDISSVSKILV